MLWTADYPSRSSPGCFCSVLCMGSVSWDSASRVPGRLAGRRLLGGRGHKGRSGSALAFHSLGFVINMEKSDLVPSKPAPYLGVTIDSGAAGVFLPLHW